MKYGSLLTCSTQFRAPSSSSSVSRPSRRYLSLLQLGSSSVSLSTLPPLFLLFYLSSNLPTSLQPDPSSSPSPLTRPSLVGPSRRRILTVSSFLCCRLLSSRSEEANKAFSAAVQMHDVLVKAWAMWGDYLENIFVKDRQLHLGVSAITCYLHACRHQNESKSRKYLAKVGRGLRMGPHLIRAELVWHREGTKHDRTTSCRKTQSEEAGERHTGGGNEGGARCSHWRKPSGTSQTITGKEVQRKRETGISK
ncbi:Transformation/transcription domain-associated protein [Liparis tanakae]|uniref:Transformation/transcription domain-associated protein n=1 Tax=Liparis tanakae TaxID=230148 RepID=A0A4Z2E2W1_9TELE|nr:Transformation/transcription domain-associated protein [Liparis tanakae]